MKIAMVSISLIFISLMLTVRSNAEIDPKNIVGMWLFDEGKGKVTEDVSGLQKMSLVMVTRGRSMELNG